jgi:hypothetical protein
MILRRFKFYSDRMNEGGLEQREYAKFGTTVSALKRHIGRGLTDAKIRWKAGMSSVGKKTQSLSPKEVTQLAANTRLIAQRGGKVGAYKMLPKNIQQNIAKEAAYARPFFDDVAKYGKGMYL